MKIEWKINSLKYEKLIQNSMSEDDKFFLCMEEKGWNKTSNEIEECVLLGKNGQYRNVVGFINNEPAVFMMLGTEFSGKILRIFNLFVMPNFRGQGVGSQSLQDVYDNVFNFEKTYSKIVTSVFPSNERSKNLVNKKGLVLKEKKDDFLEYEKEIIK